MGAARFLSWNGLSVRLCASEQRFFQHVCVEWKQVLFPGPLDDWQRALAQRDERAKPLNNEVRNVNIAGSGGRGKGRGGEHEMKLTEAGRKVKQIPRGNLLSEPEIQCGLQSVTRSIAQIRPELFCDCFRQALADWFAPGETRHPISPGGFCWLCRRERGEGCAIAGNRYRLAVLDPFCHVGEFVPQVTHGGRLHCDTKVYHR